MSLLKRILFLIWGSCWLLFAAGFAVLLVQYVSQGAGLQFFGWTLSGGSVWIGTVHVIGLILASTICFALGAFFCAHGLVRPDVSEPLADRQEVNPSVPSRSME